MMDKKILGLRATIYKVTDLAAAKIWYTNAFGVAPYFDEPFYVGFNIGGFELGLQPEDPPISEKADTVLSYWGVEDIQSVYDHLIDCGGTVHQVPTNVGGELMVASVKDPWSNVVGVIYNPYFGKE